MMTAVEAAFLLWQLESGGLSRLMIKTRVKRRAAAAAAASVSEPVEQ